MVAKFARAANTLGLMPGLQITSPEVVGDVVAEVAGQRLRTVQRFDGFLVFAIENVSVSDDEPGERSGIFFGVGTRVGFDSCVAGYEFDPE